MSATSDKAAPIWLVGFVIAVGVIGAVIALLPASDTAELPEPAANPATAEEVKPSSDQAQAPKAAPPTARPDTPKVEPATPEAKPPAADQLPPSQRTLPTLDPKTQEKLNAAMAQADAMSILLTQLLAELETARGDEVKLKSIMSRLRAQNERMTADVTEAMEGLGEGARFHFETYVKRTLGPLGSKLINQLMSELEMDQEVDENGKVRYRSRVRTEQIPPHLRPTQPAPNPTAAGAAAPQDANQAPAAPGADTPTEVDAPTP